MIWCKIGQISYNSFTHNTKMDKKKIVFIAISLFVVLLVYLPTPKHIDPEEFNPAEPVDLDDLPVSKNKLDHAVYIKTPFEGAQDVQIDEKGYVYSGLHDGSIVRIDPKTGEVVTLAKSQGAIFGLDLSRKGDKLAFADQVSGIKLLNLRTKEMQPLVSEYQGVKFASPNAVVFGPKDETLYFTVSSQTIKMSEFHEMLLYSQGSGRIFGYNFASKELELLADGLYFVNGLEYSTKDNCLYFIETSRSRLSKLDLSPEKRGNITVITKNILGYPDNVKLSESGDLWVAIPALRDSFSNIIDHNSILRRIILNLRVPLGGFLALANMKYAGGIKINPETGEIVEYLFGKADNIDCISGINEKDGKVYLSSLAKNKIAIVDVKEQEMERQRQKLREIEKEAEKAEKEEEAVLEKEKVEEKIEEKVEEVKQIKQNVQEKVADKVEQVKEQVKQKVEEVKEKVEEVVDEGKTIKQVIVDKVEEIKQGIKQGVEKAKEHVEEIISNVGKDKEADHHEDEAPEKHDEVHQEEQVVQEQPVKPQPKPKPQPTPRKPQTQGQGQRQQGQQRAQQGQKSQYGQRSGQQGSSGRGRGGSAYGRGGRGSQL